MARKRYKPEEIVAKLRQVDVLVSQLTKCFLSIVPALNSNWRGWIPSAPATAARAAQRRPTWYATPTCRNWFALPSKRTSQASSRHRKLPRYV